MRGLGSTCLIKTHAQSLQRAPKSGAVFPVTELPHCCPMPWTHSPVQDGGRTGPHGAGGRDSWEPPHHSSEHRDSCRIMYKPQPDKSFMTKSFIKRYLSQLSGKPLNETQSISDSVLNMENFLLEAERDAH